MTGWRTFRGLLRERRFATAHERFATLHDLMFLLLRQQILAPAQEEPRGPYDGQHEAELDAQHGHLPVGGARTFPGQQRGRHDDGGDL